MRIRKRQVPLPLSSLSPIPLSDPLFHSQEDHLPPVQLPTTKPPPIPSSFKDSDLLPKEKLRPDYPPEFGDGRWEKSIKYNHSRYPDNNAENSTSGSSPSPSSNSPSLSREAHTAAMKKRRLSSNGEVDNEENKIETKSNASSNGGRRRGRGGGASMEGSRCSRVNGRGWRCGQQTLVGYSLCEHHLGKGRLRSMTNVRSRFTIGARVASGKGYEKMETVNQPTATIGLKEGNSLAYSNEGGDDDEEEEEDDSASNGKKKARSMSSLLGQSPKHGSKGGSSSTMSFEVEPKDL